MLIEVQAYSAWTFLFSTLNYDIALVCYTIGTMNTKKIEHNEGWQLFSETTLLETSVARVKKGPVRCLRSGRKKEFYRFDFPNWVNVIAITPQNELVIIKQFRYGTRRVETEIPGGVIHNDEPPVIAGLRELAEETGFKGKNGRIIGEVSPNPAIQGNLCYTVLVEDAVKSAEPAMDEMEDIEVVLVPSREIPEYIRQGMITHGLVLNALLFYLNCANTTY